MLTLRHRTGTAIEVDISDAAAALLKPALASGWAFGRMVQAPLFKPLAVEPVKAPRPKKEPPIPDESVLQAVTALYADGNGRSKIKAREALQAFAPDKVDDCIAWMLHTGRMSVKGKTYTAVKENTP